MRYLTVHARPHKKSWPQDEALWNFHLTERYGDADAKTFDLAAVHAEIGVNRGKVVANHVANIVRRMYTVAGLEPPKVKKFRERSRERFLSHDEVTRLLNAAEKGTIRDFVHVCLYTGARSGNVRTMTWSEVDLDAGVWTVPATKSKNGRTLRIHLCEQVVRVLRTRERFEGTDYVFPQRGGWDVPMVQPRKVWLKVCECAGLPDITIHDLRRTLGSHLAVSARVWQSSPRCLGTPTSSLPPSTRDCRHRPRVRRWMPSWRDSEACQTSVSAVEPH